MSAAVKQREAISTQLAAAIIVNTEDQFQLVEDALNEFRSSWQATNDELNDEQQKAQDEQQKNQQFKDVKRNIKQLQSQLKSVDNMAKKLTKANITIPSDIAGSLENVRAFVKAVSSAKTWSDIEAAGFGEDGMVDMGEFFEPINESRQIIEQLTRWPQTEKETTRQITQMTRELKNGKRFVTQLEKKGIDVSDMYATWEESFNPLKSAVDEARRLARAGSVEEAFEKLESDFFGSMDDFWQNQRVFMMMTNLSQFPNQFKRGLADAQRVISRAQKKKLDTSELTDLLNESKAKGAEVIVLIKARPFDEEAVMSVMMELEELKGSFENTAGELLGEEDRMPWEQGSQGGGPGGPGMGPGGPGGPGMGQMGPGPGF